MAIDPLLSQTLSQTLKTAGYSVTKPRAAVFTVLSGQEPQSMAEVVQKLSGIIDRATVYRTVDLFEKLGIVTRLNLGWKYKIELSENFSHHHHHLSCVNCGQVVAFEEGQVLHQAIEHLATAKGYSMQDHSLEIRGLCPACYQLKDPGKTPGSAEASHFQLSA